MQGQPLSKSQALFREEGRAAFITLDRPEALHALSLQMIRDMEFHCHKWMKTPRVYGVILEASPARAFCAGGDIRAVHALGPARSAEALAYYREEYQLDWTLHRFGKPQIALIDGLVLGGGVGISLYGTQRAAGENFQLGMPECAIGFFPDVGASCFLSRLPGETGMYLALSGARVGPADAYHLGLATQCIPSSSFNRIREAVIEGDPIDPVLWALHKDPGQGEIQRLQPVIDRIFSAGSVEAILAALDDETGEAAGWARKTAAMIRRGAPLSLKVTHRLIREGRRQKSLKAALQTEFRLASRFLRSHDFHEGVRAALIDRDRSPSWRPASLSEVSDDQVSAHFEPSPDGELELIDHWTAPD